MKNEITTERLQQLVDEYVEEAEHQGIEFANEAYIVQRYPKAVKALMKDFFLYANITEGITK